MAGLYQRRAILREGLVSADGGSSQDLTDLIGWGGDGPDVEGGILHVVVKHLWRWHERLNRIHYLRKEGGVAGLMDLTSKAAEGVRKPCT